MKATRIVYASFAVAAPAILVLAACGASGPAPGTPAAFYVDLGCAKCHGNEREGLRSGPPLDNLQDRWQEESLVEYFRDPKAVMEAKPRLKYMAENYPIVMPAFPGTSDDDLYALARYVLSDSGQATKG